MKRILLLLVVASIGGVISAFLMLHFMPARFFSRFLVTSSQTPPVPRTDDSHFEGFPNITEAAESMVWLWQKGSASTLLSRADAASSGIVLTGDGLIATVSVPARTLIAASFDRHPFVVEPAQDLTGKALRYGSGPLMFLRPAASEAKGLHLKPVTFFSFEEVRTGQPLFSFGDAGVPEFFRVSEVMHRPTSHEVLSSEVLSGGIALDHAPKAGALLFAASGAFVGLAQNDGTVMPAEFLNNFLRQYLKNGTYQKTTFGMHFFELSALVPLNHDLPFEGLLLASKQARRAVMPGSSAARAGLKEGDVLTLFDGQRLDNTLPFELLLQRYLPGTTVDVVFLRAGKEEKRVVVLGGQ